MVLFPHARVQLHIFEHRYREMIQHCIEENSRFGIVLIRNGDETGDLAEPYLVGTSVRIVDVHTYEDGRFDITVVGLSRFRIREIDDSKAYLTARIETIDEDGAADIVELQETANEAREYCEQIIRGEIEHSELNITVLFPNEPEKLSFAIANMLEMPLLKKQLLLETTDTLHRLHDLISMLHLHIDDRRSYRRLRSADLREWVSPN